MAFATALLIAFALAQSPDPILGAPVLVLRCGETPGEVMLSIHNPDETDTAVLLGVSLANGRWYLPRELVVELRHTGNPEVEELVFRLGLHLDLRDASGVSSRGIENPPHRTVNHVRSQPGYDRDQNVARLDWHCDI